MEQTTNSTEPNVTTIKVHRDTLHRLLARKNKYIDTYDKIISNMLDILEGKEVIQHDLIK